MFRSLPKALPLPAAMLLFVVAAGICPAWAATEDINERWHGHWKSRVYQRHDDNILIIQARQFNGCEWTTKQKVDKIKHCAAYYSGTVRKKQLLEVLNSDERNIVSMYGKISMEQKRAFSDYRQIVSQLSDDNFRTVDIVHPEDSSGDVRVYYIFDKGVVYKVVEVFAIAGGFSITAYDPVTNTGSWPGHAGPVTDQDAADLTKMFDGKTVAELAAFLKPLCWTLQRPVAGTPLKPGATVRCYYSFTKGDQELGGAPPCGGGETDPNGLEIDRGFAEISLARKVLRKTRP